MLQALAPWRTRGLSIYSQLFYSCFLVYQLILKITVSHRNKFNSTQHVASSRLPTRWGEFRIAGFEQDCEQAGWPKRQSAVALMIGDVTRSVPLLRIHSQCLTGDVFGSLRCDCGKQLEMALCMIAEAGCGIVIYEQQEGRGIGLISKLLAYEQQDLGADTVEANERLGLKNDYRDFSFATEILRSLGIFNVRLLSNNPEKAAALRAAGIEIATRIPCEVEAHPCAKFYLQTKRERLGHLLTANPAGAPKLHARRSASPIYRNRPTGFAVPRRSPFTDVETAIIEMRAGRMVILVDDEGRENEGDLTMAAEKVTPEAINFMAQYGRGLICLSMTPERVDYLQLPPIAAENTAPYGTAFTQSIDVIGRGTTTGISAYDRAQTILAALDPSTRPSDLARPGHIFPLRAQSGGVLARAGQTEASVDLARLAGLAPAGVICEIMNADGTMARLPDLAEFSGRHGIKVLSVADLISYRSFCEQQTEASTSYPIRA